MIILNKHKDKIPCNAIYAGRGSVYGNPYPIDKDNNRETVIKKFEEYFINEIISNNRDIINGLKKLHKDSVLFCYCRPKPCHVEIIEKIWNEINDLGNGDFDKGVNEYILKHSDMYLLEEDGISHLNIYSRGKTELGRFLSNFALSPFIHPKFGSFNTVEGFWHYLRTGKKYECFRTLSGMDCKKISKQYEKQDCDNFQRYIKEAILLKIESNEKFKLLLKESTLPLTHYYYYGDESTYKIVVPDNSKWLINYIEDIREYLNNKALKLIIAGSRSIEDYDKLKDVFNTLPYPVIEIVDGMARHGVDMLGVRLANELNIPLKEFPANWDKYKKSAGMLRNKEMSIYANGLLALWDGESPGTKNMIELMKNKKDKLISIYYDYKLNQLISNI